MLVAPHHSQVLRRTDFRHSEKCGETLREKLSAFLVLFLWEGLGEGREAAKASLGSLPENGALSCAGCNMA